MGEQGKLNLVGGLQAGYRTAGNELLADIRLVVQTFVPKRFILAEDLGVKESHLSEALNGNGKNFDVRWLPGVSRYDRSHVIATRVAGWKGLKVIEPDPLTPEEKLTLLRAELARGGADVDEIERRAYAEGRP